MGVRHRVFVALEDLPGDQAGEVRHVDHEGGTDLVGDFRHPGEVHPARIGRITGHQDERLELPDGRGDGVVVEQASLRIGAVAALL